MRQHCMVMEGLIARQLMLGVVQVAGACRSTTKRAMATRRRRALCCLRSSRVFVLISSVQGLVPADDCLLLSLDNLEALKTVRLAEHALLT